MKKESIFYEERSAYYFKYSNPRTIMRNPFLIELERLGLAGCYEESIWINMFILGRLKQDGTTKNKFAFEQTFDNPLCSFHPKKREMYDFVNVDKRLLNSGLINMTFEPESYGWITNPLGTVEQAKKIVSLSYHSKKDLGLDCTLCNIYRGYTQVQEKQKKALVSLFSSY